MPSPVSQPVHKRFDASFQRLQVEARVARENLNMETQNMKPTISITPYTHGATAVWSGWHLSHPNVGRFGKLLWNRRDGNAFVLLSGITQWDFATIGAALSFVDALIE
jgi:hypothetical protein